MAVYKLTGILVALGVILFTAVMPGLAQEPQTNVSLPAYVPGEILVKFNQDSEGIEGQSLLLSNNLSLLEVSPYGLIRVSVPQGRETEISVILQNHPRIKFAHPNYILTTNITPNDPYFSNQWALNNTGQTGGTINADINAPEAWDIHTGNSASVIAIVDTGVDLDHPDLEDNLWTNNSEIPNNGLDDDNNGYIDDVNGWDFCTTLSSTCNAPNDNNPDDEQGHGTHVAGIVAARGNNGIGVTGVSWAAKIMPVKSLDQFGGGTVSSVTNGINYAADNGATIINLSLGAAGSSYPCFGFEAIRDAMQNALAKDALVVAASGNQGSIFVACPGAFDEAFAVGATDHNDNRWNGSNRGIHLDIAAPGVNIYNTAIGGGYTYKTGTSMATPHVAGLAALIKSFSPGLSHTDVRSIIESTAKDLGAAGKDIEFGHGRINAYLALQSLANLQTSPSQTGFLMDDNTSPLPLAGNIQIISAAPNTISWTATISPAVPWLSFWSAAQGTVSGASSPEGVSIAATKPATYGVYSTTVIITGTTETGQALGTRSTRVDLTYASKLTGIYLPIVMRNAAPDLIVESITATGNTIQITIKNQGSLPVTDAFWVDAYINPNTPPTGVNQAWYDVGTQGLVWGVTTLPIAPGQSVTLTLNDAYYRADLSNFSTPLPSGTPIYAQADSYNLSTTYGAIFESNENNNIASIFSIADTNAVKMSPLFFNGDTLPPNTLPQR